MARFRITGPDGGSYEVTAPDDADENQVMEYVRANAGERTASLDTSTSGPSRFAAPKIAGADLPSNWGIDFNQPNDRVRAEIAKLPADQRKAAVRAWADQWVAKERKGGGIMQGVSDTVRNLARGTPVGSWLDEANAATASLMGTPYEEALEYQRATDRAIDKGSTKIAGPVTVADATKVAGGVASVVATPVVNVFRGAAMLPQMGNAALTGMGYGALYGAGQGEDTEGRLVESGKGLALGGAIGAASVPVARAVGNTVEAVRNRMTPLPQGVQRYDRGAVARVARAATDDDLPARYQQQVADLGPEGMMADMGLNLRGQASAIANQPGRGQQRITEALHDRRQGAAGRIAADVDQALGPPANMPETAHATQQHYRAQAAPHRQQFQNNPVPFTQDLDDTLQLLVQNEPGVIHAARRYANIDPAAGPNQFFARQLPNGQFEIIRVPNATEWDYLKRALDGMSGRTATPNDQRIYGSLARRLRTQVDEAISPGAPDQSPWAQARRLEAEDFQIRDAMDAGRGAFSRELTPDQMRAEMYGVGQPPQGGMTPPELAGYGVGARDQVRTIMGNAATAHGENAATGARRALGSDYAREKLDLIAGPQAAGQLTRRLDAETVFDNTRQAVTQNSATARRLQAQEEFPNAAAEGAASVARRGVSLPGLVWDGVHRIANIVTGGAINERNARIAADAAEMLIAQGLPRDQVAQGVLAFAQQRGITAAQRQAINNVGMMILSGGRQKAIEAMGAE